MPDFMLQEKPEANPRSCYFCHSFEGPWVNPMREDAAGVTILLCAPNGKRESGCAGQIANLIGGLTPAAARDLRLERDQAENRAEALKAQLERLRDGVMEAVA